MTTCTGVHIFQSKVECRLVIVLDLESHRGIRYENQLPHHAFYTRLWRGYYMDTVDRCRQKTLMTWWTWPNFTVLWNHTQWIGGQKGYLRFNHPAEQIKTLQRNLSGWESEPIEVPHTRIRCKLSPKRYRFTPVCPSPDDGILTKSKTRWGKGTFAWASFAQTLGFSVALPFQGLYVNLAGPENYHRFRCLNSQIPPPHGYYFKSEAMILGSWLILRESEGSIQRKSA